MNITTQEFNVSAESEVKLTLTVSADTVKQIYNDIVVEYRKSARIKGFRPGKVPEDVLVRKFGPSLLAQATEQVVRDSLEQSLSKIEQKPLPFAPPNIKPEHPLDLETDFTYTATYDTYPQIEIETYQNLTVEQLDVNIIDSDLEQELSRLQEQNAVVIEKTSDNDTESIVEKGDVVTVNYEEQDENGVLVVGSERRDFVFEIGSENNIYQMDDELVGMTRGAEKTFSKSFPSDYRYSDLADRTVSVKVSVTSIKEKQLPDLDDELAQDIDDHFKTLEDLKTDLQTRLESDAERRVRSHVINQLMEKIIETSKVPLPKTMIEADLESEWQNLVARSGGNSKQFEAILTARGETKQQMLDHTRPMIEKRTQFLLVREKLIETSKIEIDEKDIDSYLSDQAKTRDVTQKELREQYERENLLDYVRSELRNEKLYDYLIEENEIKTGKKTTYMDLMQLNQ